MKNVQNTHINENLRRLHGALLDIVGVMNRPQGDELLLREAAIPLDRALFPLLVGIGKFGPIGVVELAERAGRDYTTISRQLGKLEELGLVERREGREDRRVREAAVTTQGAALTARIDAARERRHEAIFADWAPGEIDEFVRLTRKYADALKDVVSAPAPAAPPPAHDAPDGRRARRASPRSGPRD
jgi:DNA-binding MarR family transcriptional regulator